MKAAEYHMNYATVKSRGVDESDSVYTLTVHKNPVRRSGFECPSVIKQTIFRLENSMRSTSDNGEAEYLERLANSISRSKQSLVQLTANNEWEYFVTLTVSCESDADRMDLTDCKKKILKFFTNYSQRAGKQTDFKYMLIPEQHKDGAWHFHGLMKGINPKDLFVNEHGYLDFRPYRERFGFFSSGGKRAVSYGAFGTDADYCSMGKIKDLKRCASYISKYISKDMFVGQQMENNLHLYFASNGLKRDKLIIKGEPCVNASDFLEAGYNGYENEYCTKVLFPEESEAVECISPFPADEFKLGVNIPLTLSEKTKQQAIVRQVIKYCNRTGCSFEYEMKRNSINFLWKTMLKDHAYMLTEYDELNKKYQDKKQLRKSFSKCLEQNTEKLSPEEDEIINSIFVERPDGEADENLSASEASPASVLEQSFSKIVEEIFVQLRDGKPIDEILFVPPSVPITVPDKFISSAYGQMSLPDYDFAGGDVFPNELLKVYT